MYFQGYPPDKLRYYRGGMQMWQVLGLTTVIPNNATAGTTEREQIVATSSP